MKSRKQGNEIILRVPSKFNIEPNEEFIAIKGEMGSITYIPKLKENVFKKALKNGKSLRFNDEFAEDSKFIGREEI